MGDYNRVMATATASMVNTSMGTIPRPSHWNAPLYQFVADDSEITLLEKQSGKTTLEDITDALDEYTRLFKAGIASKAEIVTLNRAYPDNTTYIKAVSKLGETEPIVVGGPASVELIDREGHLITTSALKQAFSKYMDNFRTRNTMVLHSDVQVGWALPAYISKGGQIFKSGVDDAGLFFITEIRDDTRIAQRVVDQIHEGKLKSYSIAGSATKTQNMQKGLVPYMQVDEMELAEITVCEKGVNQGAGFDILKAHNAATQSCSDGSCLAHLEKEDENPEQPGKINKDQSQYRIATDVEKKNGIACDSCKYFNGNEGSCDIVMGEIEGHMYCDLFFPEEGTPVALEERSTPMTLMVKGDGEVDFFKSFIDYMGQSGIRKAASEPFDTLYNFAGRTAEHHRLLREQGWPSEQPQEAMRYVPVVETETDNLGIPIKLKPPWVVNEAGEHLGKKLDGDAPTYKDSVAGKAAAAAKASAHPWYSPEIEVGIKKTESISATLQKDLASLGLVSMGSPPSNPTTYTTKAQNAENDTVYNRKQSGEIKKSTSLRKQKDLDGLTAHAMDDTYPGWRSNKKSYGDKWDDMRSDIKAGYKKKS